MFVALVIPYVALATAFYTLGQPVIAGTVLLLGPLFALVALASKLVGQMNALLPLLSEMAKMLFVLFRLAKGESSTGLDVDALIREIQESDEDSE